MRQANLLCQNVDFFYIVSCILLGSKCSLLILLQAHFSQLFQCRIYAIPKLLLLQQLDSAMV